MPSVVKVIAAANGAPTPHDNRYVKEWNPHTRAGTLELTSTPNIYYARRFKDGAEFDEWRTVSNIQPVRPWDGQPNRPLTAVTVEIVQLKE